MFLYYFFEKSAPTILSIRKIKQKAAWAKLAQMQCYGPCTCSHRLSSVLFRRDSSFACFPAIPARGVSKTQGSFTGWHDNPIEQMKKQNDETTNRKQHRVCVRWKTWSGRNSLYFWLHNGFQVSQMLQLLFLLLMLGTHIWFWYFRNLKRAFDYVFFRVSFKNPQACSVNSLPRWKGWIILIIRFHPSHQEY